MVCHSHQSTLPPRGSVRSLPCLFASTPRPTRKCRSRLGTFGFGRCAVQAETSSVTGLGAAQSLAYPIFYICPFHATAPRHSHCAATTKQRKTNGLIFHYGTPEMAPGLRMFSRLGVRPVAPSIPLSLVVPLGLDFSRLALLRGVMMRCGFV